MWSTLLELVLRLIAWLTSPKAPKPVEAEHVKKLEAADEEARRARLAELDEKIAAASGADDAGRLLRDVTGAPDPK